MKTNPKTIVGVALEVTQRYADGSAATITFPDLAPNPRRGLFESVCELTTETSYDHDDFDWMTTRRMLASEPTISVKLDLDGWVARPHTDNQGNQWAYQIREHPAPLRMPLTWEGDQG